MPVGIGAAILGGSLLSGLASNSASKAQQAASAQATAEQRRQYDTSRADAAPWRDAGKLSLSRLMELMGLGPQAGAMAAPDRAQYTSTTTTPGAAGSSQTPYNPYNPNNGIQNDYGLGRGAGPTTQTTFDQAGFDKAQQAYQSQSPSSDYGMLMKQFTGQDLQNEPGYQFGLSEGEKGINRAASARGGYDSGSALKSLLKYNQDYAGTKYDAAFNRDQIYKNQVYNQLAGISGTGQTATAQTAALGANAANQIGQNYQNAGDARAAGIVGVGNAVNQGIGSYINYNQSQSLLDALKKPSYGGVTGV
jgi:hypothetical protein